MFSAAVSAVLVVYTYLIALMVLQLHLDVIGKKIK